MKSLRNLILLSVSLILSLLICESLVRVFAPQHLIRLRPDIWCPDEGLGWVLCPNVDAWVDMGDGPARVHTDAEGHRINPSRDREKPDVEILAIGDSFVEAMQVNDHESMTEVLSDLLSEKLNRRVVIVNAGVSSWNPNQYLIRSRRELQKKNDYAVGVVFIYPDNDVVSEIKGFYPARQRGLPHRFRMPVSIAKRELVDALLYPINDALERSSHLFISLRIHTKQWLMRFGLSGYEITPVWFKKQAGSPDWAITGAVLGKIAAEFEKYQVPVIFAFLPAIYQVTPDIFVEYTKGFGIDPGEIDLGQPNRILSQSLTENYLAFIDTTPFLKEAAARGEVLYGTVDPHFTVAGHRAVAQSLQPEVERLLTLKRGMAERKIEQHSTSQ